MGIPLATNVASEEILLDTTALHTHTREKMLLHIAGQKEEENTNFFPLNFYVENNEIKFYKDMMVLCDSFLQMCDIICTRVNPLKQVVLLWNISVL